MQDPRNPTQQLNAEAKILVKFLSTINKCMPFLIQVTESIRPSIERRKLRASKSQCPCERRRPEESTMWIFRNGKETGKKRQKWRLSREQRMAIILRRKTAQTTSKTFPNRTLSWANAKLSTQSRPNRWSTSSTVLPEISRQPPILPASNSKKCRQPPKICKPASASNTPNPNQTAGSILSPKPQHQRALF